GGLARSTDPAISHVTLVVLHEFCDRLVTVPVAVTAPEAAGRLAIALGLTATGLFVPVGLPPAGHAASVKFVSLTMQFARSAVAEFVTVIVTAFLPLASLCAQSLVTVRPGVRQSTLAVSCATAIRFGFRSAVQKQLTDAVSGSA